MSFLRDSILEFIGNNPGCFAWEVIQHLNRTKKGVDASKILTIIDGMVPKELTKEACVERKGTVYRYWKAGST